MKLKSEQSENNNNKYKSEFIELISNRLGINIRQDHMELSNIVDEACKKFDCTAIEYLRLLEKCNDSSPLLEHLVAGITIGETYFFRDKRQVELLQNTVLPDLIKAKRINKNLTLRIWSAGCSSGEEIYTIAMLLSELLPDLDKWSISLLATDININVLQKAKIGKYNKWSMRSISDYFTKKYFVQNKNTYTISPDVNSMVDFQYLNLNDDTYPSILNNTNSLDLIICRNVLIYFSEPVITNIMKKIAACLSDDGCLLLGASDPVSIDQTDLVFHHNHGMLFSRKQTAKKDETDKQKIKKSPEIKPVKLAKPYQKTEAAKTIKTHPSKETMSGALPNNNRLNDASTISQTSQLNTKAKEAANHGQLETAIKYCENSLILDATNKETYFTYALTLLELNRFEDAIAAFRKVIFLDRGFVEGHFQLGLLLLKTNQYKLGMKSLYNALKIVEANDPIQVVQGSEGLTYGRFKQILQAEIELYSSLKGQIDG